MNERHAVISVLLGLGNIGFQYEGTRHNIGFDLLDQVAASLGARPRLPAGAFDWAEAARDAGRVHLVWPRTMVNRSGEAASAILRISDHAPHEMLVVVDDLNLPLGKIRLRPGGSDGGHRGLASIMASLETSDVPRLRLGIGPPPDQGDVAPFVLSRFGPDELPVRQKMLDIAREAALFTLQHRLDEAMNKYNVNPA